MSKPYLPVSIAGVQVGSAELRKVEDEKYVFSVVFNGGKTVDVPLSRMNFSGPMRSLFEQSERKG